MFPSKAYSGAFEAKTIYSIFVTGYSLYLYHSLLIWQGGEFTACVQCVKFACKAAVGIWWRAQRKWTRRTWWKRMHYIHELSQMSSAFVRSKNINVYGIFTSNENIYLRPIL